jgi:hypothetical protein
MVGLFKYNKIALPVIFLLIIFFFFLNYLFSFTQDIKNNENRMLATKPSFDINHLDDFPTNFENYYNDNFNPRNLFIKYYNILYKDYYKKSPIPDKVIFGKNDWYFFNGTHGSTYRGIDHFTSEELNDFRDELVYRRHYLEARGTKYYFVILPTKYSIYPEYLPDNILRFRKQTMADQVMEACGNNPEINILDMRKVLLDAKKHNLRLYQKTDSHWNYAGAYFCYHNLIENLNKDFPDMHPLEKDKFVIDSAWQEGGDLSKMLGLSNIVRELDVIFYPNFVTSVTKGKKQNYDPGSLAIPEDYEAVRVNPKLKGPKLLVMRDSYTWLLVNYLSEHFSKSVYIFDSWEYKLNEDIVEKEKPDVVISIVLECFLKNVVKNMSHKKTPKYTQK